MNLLNLPQFKRNARRFEQIVRILARYGLADWLREKDPEFIKRLLKGPEGERLSDLSSAERTRMALTELGTTFIKLGQMLSTRVDLVGPELAEQLSRLQSGTPADPPEIVRATIETELGHAPEELFARFEDTPLGSASIAQVHRAELKDGTLAVVKVQHPGIEDTIINDLEILIALAELAETYSEDLRLYQPKATASQFRDILLRELDFQQEEQNLLLCGRNFDDDPTVQIPKPFPEFSSRRVLTMERVEGIPVAKKNRLESENIDRKELARRGANVFLEMIFRDRVYHADPHPGNIVVLPGNVVGLLDFGMVGRLDDRTREAFEGLIHAFLLRDGELLTDYALQLGTAPPGLDRDDLQTDIEAFVAANLTGSLKDMDTSHVLDGFANLVRRHRIIQRPGISLLIKVLIMLEGTSRLLNPDFNLAELLEPYYRKMVERKLSPKSLFRRVQKTYRDWDQLFQGLPRDLTDILRRFRKGTLDVHLDHRHLDNVTNRLAFGIVTAALFLGSTLIVSQRIPPTFYDISLPGSAGMIFSLWLLSRLLRAIKKSGGL